MRFPLIENLIWTLVVVLIVAVIVLIIYLKILRRNIRVVESRSQKYTNYIEGLLIEYLHLDQSSENFLKTQKKIISEFKKGVKNRRKRRIITNTFLKLSQQVSGNVIDIMHNLYEEIGLIYFAKQKIKSKKWNIIALGIRDLRQFEVKKFAPIIKKFVNHKKEEVRREAHLYFLELFEFEGLQFLDTLELPLSEWDQIELLIEIEKFDNQHLLDVKKWLKSENDYVILFILNIVKIFNRLETKELLLALLHHENLDIRLKTIEVVTYFEITEAKEILIEKFESLTIEEKKALFEFLEKVATKKDSLFVLEHIKDLDFEIKSKALTILKKHDAELYNKLDKSSEDASYNRIIEYLDYSYGF